MKKIILLLAIACSVLISCKNEQKSEANVTEQSSTIQPMSPAVMENAVIYEANIRQYSPEGTFNAFTKDIPHLKELGVRIVWVMPINPISKIKRKSTDGRFTSEIKDEKERAKYLGSYYSVSDYKAINPEFGTLEDFKNLVKTAHENGIYLIVDWVPNHTGWDHPWITEHPDYYTHNDKGEIIDPINPETGKSWGWTDTADLNYDNPNMRKEMIADLKYWINVADIDGYRMDVAHGVPVDFFETAVKELKKIKPVFMLAEAEKPKLLKNAFDMQYGWEALHIFNRMAKGQATVKAFDDYMVKMDSTLEDDDIDMYFVTNHDENSWNGTLKERMPNNKEIFTALVYTIPGMPLIYSGQEFDLDHALKFFEKDSIPKIKGEYYKLLEKLGQLKNSNPALNGGKHAASYERIPTNNDHILMFKRQKEGSMVTFIGNFFDEEQTLENEIEGSPQDYIAGKPLEIEGDHLILKPWEYKILID